MLRAAQINWHSLGSSKPATSGVFAIVQHCSPDTEQQGWLWAEELSQPCLVEPRSGSAECCLGLGYRVAASPVSEAAFSLCTSILERGASRQEVGEVVPFVLAKLATLALGLIRADAWAYSGLSR